MEKIINVKDYQIVQLMKIVKYIILKVKIKIYVLEKIKLKLLKVVI